MDPLTNSLAAFTLARTGLGRLLPRGDLVMIAAVHLPDLDLLSLLLSLRLGPAVEHAGANPQFLGHFGHWPAEVDQAYGLVSEITAVSFADHGSHGACPLFPGPRC